MEIKLHIYSCTTPVISVEAAAQVHLLLYCVQLNCTYSNYTEAAAASCSAAQLNSTFNVQILYKMYSVQLNCT